MRKKKILFFVGNLSSGGKERRVLVLLQGLIRLDKYKLHLVLIRNKIHYPEFKKLNIEYSYIVEKKDKKNPFRILIKLFSIVMKSRPGLLSVWGNEEASYMALVSFLLRIPMVNNQITSATKPDNMLVRISNRINFVFSDYIISNSYAGIRNSNTPKHKSGVIHNGLDNGRFVGKESHIRKELSIPQDSIVIVMVARFSPGKDYETLLEVANNILSSGKDVWFLLVGDGTERSRIEKLNTGAYRDMIIFLGLRNDVEEILLGSDIGVLLNDKNIVEEGLSNSILEYMAAGLPVVATNAGGTPEIVQDGITGYLARSKDLKQIQKKLESLINESGLRQRMGENAKNRIVRDFSINTFIEKHDALIERFAN